MQARTPSVFPLDTCPPRPPVAPLVSRSCCLSRTLLRWAAQKTTYPSVFPCFAPHCDSAARSHCGRSSAVARHMPEPTPKSRNRDYFWNSSRFRHICCCTLGHTVVPIHIGTITHANGGTPTVARTAKKRLRKIVQVRFLRQSTCSTGRGETLQAAITNATKAHRDLAGSMRGFGPLVPDSISVFVAIDSSVTVSQIHDDLDADDLRHCTQIIL
jgi:hypothetical protein